MDDTSPLPSTMEKWSECISVWPLPSWVNDVVWSLSLHSSVVRWSRGIKLPPKLWQSGINHDDTPRFYSITLLAKIKLITKTNIWTYISIITTTLNDQNHILETCIGSALIFLFWLNPICLHGEGGVYDLYCSQPPGGDQEPTASLKITFQDEWDTPDTHTLTFKCLGSVLFDKTDQNWRYSKDFYINAHEMFKDFFQKHYDKTLPTPTFWTVEYIY